MLFMLWWPLRLAVLSAVKYDKKLNIRMRIEVSRHAPRAVLACAIPYAAHKLDS
jgi:hypothetical protein